MSKEKLFCTENTKQRINVIISVLIELYRVSTSSLLILFVPQRCDPTIEIPDSHICSLKENILLGTKFYNASLFFNFVTLFSFIIMYTFEIIRENRLINYLDVSSDLPTDNNNVGEALKPLDIEKKNKIYKIDKYHKYSSYVSLFIYCVNIVLSSITIHKYYLNNQTTSAFITYVLFMFIKLYNVYIIANTDENIFYSSYLMSHIQFNDIDKKYKQRLNEL